MKSRTDEQAEYMILMFEEQSRLHSLSDRELVIECLSSEDDELVVEEMMTRIYPNWTKLTDGELRGH